MSWGDLASSLSGDVHHGKYLMRHTFAGDPWGPCSRCWHPACHPIHNTDVVEDEDENEATD